MSKWSFGNAMSGKMPPEENCPPVGLRVWFRVSVRIRVGGNFHWGNFL